MENANDNLIEELSPDVVENTMGQWFDETVDYQVAFGETALNYDEPINDYFLNINQEPETTIDEPTDYSPETFEDKPKGLAKLFSKIKSIMSGNNQELLSDGNQKYDVKPGAEPLTGIDMAKMGFPRQGIRAMASKIGQFLTSPFARSKPVEPAETLTPSTPSKPVEIPNDFDKYVLSNEQKANIKSRIIVPQNVSNTKVQSKDEGPVIE